MAWVEVVQCTEVDAVASAAPRSLAPHTSSVTPAPDRALVPACHCSGRCHCGTLVPYLLQQQIERECEFFREEL